MDIQESREDWAKELSISKHPRYQGPSVLVAPVSTVIKDSGLMQLFKEKNGPEAEDHG